MNGAASEIPPRTPASTDESDSSDRKLARTESKLNVLTRIAAIANNADEATDAYNRALPLLLHYAEMAVCRVHFPDVHNRDRLARSGLWFGDHSEALDQLRAAEDSGRLQSLQITAHRALDGQPVWGPEAGEARPGHASKPSLVSCQLAFPVTANREVVAVVELLDTRPREREDDLAEVCTFVGSALGRVAERELAASVDPAREQALASEIARRNEGLSLARRRAAVSSRSAEAFFTALSHDLKTPLHTILAVIAETAPDGTGITSEQRDTIREAAENMIARVDHLLSLSPRSNDDSGPSEVIIASVLTPALSAYREVLALQGQRLSVGLSPDTNEPALTDSGGLLLALDSVMGRIVTAKGVHTVHIDVSFGGPELVTVVSCPTDLLDAETLAALSATDVPPSASLLVDAEGDEILVRITTPARRLSGIRQSHVPRVLLVDDNQVTCRLGAAMITSLGYEVALATSGAEAISVLREQPFGLVLMDIRMPERDGLSTTRGIRAGEAGEDSREVPIVALTANAAPGDAEQSLLAGMDGHVTKPFDKGRLAQVVSAHIVSDK